MIRIKVEIEDIDSTLVDRCGKTFFVNDQYNEEEWTRVIEEVRRYLEEIRDERCPEIITGGGNETEG